MTFLALTILCNSQTLEYQYRCRQFYRIYKVRCAVLTLYDNKTFIYKETATDLPTAEQGQYYVKGDTIILNTPNFGTVKYFKKNKSLIKKTSSYFMPKKFKKYKKAKA
ncbi:MAG TPA: hypothetical protein DFI01_03345 [Bacteroidales bacterium]|nr:hypothetical protein [Bacteroidales bacterium]